MVIFLVGNTVGDVNPTVRRSVGGELRDYNIFNRLSKYINKRYTISIRHYRG